MACIRKRRGKYVVDYRDGAGIRHWVTCETRREAETVLFEKAREARQHTRPVVDPSITLSAYAERWLREIAVTIKPKTQNSYAVSLRRHILPMLGPTKVRMLQKGRIESFLLERLRHGSPTVVRRTKSTTTVHSSSTAAAARAISIGTAVARCNAACSYAARSPPAMRRASSSD